MTQYRSTFTTPEQALAEALFLALMAPGESEAQAAAMLAEEIAADHGLDEQAVEFAKAAALAVRARGFGHSVGRDLGVQRRHRDREERARRAELAAGGSRARSPKRGSRPAAGGPSRPPPGIRH